MTGELAIALSEAEKAFDSAEAGPYTVSGESGRTIIVVGEDDEIRGMVLLPSTRYLAKPRSGRWPTFDVVREDERTRHGHPSFISRGRPDYLNERIGNRSLPGPGEADLIATIDTSVLLAGMDPSKFRDHEAIFVSEALELEMSVLERKDVETGAGGYSFADWGQSVPVPMDHEVLSLSRVLWQRGENAVSPLQRSELSRIDVVCAGTAIRYNAPLYTTRPDDYKDLGKKVRTLEYGPTRAKRH